MKKWTDRLSQPVFNRLAACRTIKADLPELVAAKYAQIKEEGKNEFTKEDALICILELLDCNGFDADLPRDDYNALCK